MGPNYIHLLKKLLADQDLDYQALRRNVNVDTKTRKSAWRILEVREVVADNMVIREPCIRPFTEVMTQLKMFRDNLRHFMI
jgi:hypothetical protein